MSFRLERVRAGKSVKDTAEQLGVSRVTVWSWETGETLPRAGRLKEIAEYFGCSVEDLLRDDMKHTKKSVQKNGQ